MNGARDSLAVLAEHWWFYVLHATWQSTLLGLVILLVVLALGRRSASLRYGLLVVALLKFAVPPMLALPTGLFSRAAVSVVEPPVKLADTGSRRSETANEGHVVDGGTFPALHPASLSDSLASTVDGHTQDDLTARSTPTAQTFASPVTTSKSPERTDAVVAVAPPGVDAVLLSWRTGLLLIHAIGTLSVALWIVYSWLEIQKLVRKCRPIDDVALRNAFSDLHGQLGLRRNVRLLISPGNVSPMGFGVLRPTVMLPDALLHSLSEEETVVVLAHELAHHRRKDTWWVLMEDLLLLVWWFNPVLWMLVRELRRTREDCCDDLVLAMDITDNAQYCNSLVNAANSVACPRPVHVALGLADRLHPLGRRFKRIMDTTLRRTTKLSIVGGLILIAVGLAVLPGLRFVAAEESVQTSAASGPPAQAAASAPRPPTTATTVLSGIVSGVVMNDTTGEPVPGAFVAIDHTGDAGGANLERFNEEGLYVTTETEAEGRYALENVALRDNHPLYVTASGFVRYEQTVSLTPQHPEQTLEVRLRPGATIVARCEDEAGAPEADVALRLTAEDGRLFLPPRGDWPAWPYRFEPATDGQYEFADLAPGRFGVEAIQIGNRTIVYLGAAETEVAEGETKTLRIESRPRDTKATVTVAADPYQLKEQPRTVFALGPELDPSLPQGHFVHPEDERLGRILANAIVVQHDLSEDASREPSSGADVSVDRGLAGRNQPSGRE